jgi:hypothetical protein
MLRAAMGQHLKSLAPKHGMIRVTVDNMFNHTDRQVANRAYDKQTRNEMVFGLDFHQYMAYCMYDAKKLPTTWTHGLCSQAIQRHWYH